MKDEPTPLTHGEEWLKPIGVPDYVVTLAAVLGLVLLIETLIVVWAAVAAHG